MATGKKKARNNTGLGRAGFTAIELILVLTVLVTASAVVLPGFPAFARVQRVRAATSQLSGMMRYAQRWSVEQKLEVNLTYDPSERTFSLALAEDDLQELLAQPEPSTESAEPDTEDQEPTFDAKWELFRLPDKVELVGGTLGEETTFDGSQPMRFLPDGRADDAVIVLGDDQTRCTVRLDGRRGRVVLEEGDGLEETADGTGAQQTGNTTR